MRPRLPCRIISALESLATVDPWHLMKTTGNTIALRRSAPSRYDVELRRELEHHVELLASDYERAGLPAHEARRRALVAFGGLEQIKEECRDTLWFSGVVRAVRMAVAVARGR